ncbi:MAG: hypothetical protein ACP5T2_04955 [Thermoprotei archaeon]
MRIKIPARSVLIIVFVLACVPLVNLSAAASSKPAYAFEGAYAKYSINYTSYNTTAGVTYLISHVNANAQTFNVYVNFSGVLAEYYTPQNETVTFSNPSPFPAVNSSILGKLNQGISPSGLNITNLTRSVELSLPAGNFATDKLYISQGNLTIWIWQNTGMIVKETVGPQSAPYMVLQLEKTNITASAYTITSYYLYLFAFIVAVVIVLVVLIALAGRRKAVKSAPQAEPVP